MAESYLGLTDEQTAELTRRSPDGMLREIVESVNLHEEGRTSFITLQMKGVLVTGTLISHWLWSELMSKRVASVTGREESYFAGWSSDFKEDKAAAADQLARWDDLSDEEKRDSLMQRTPAFIHLEGARLLVGNNLMPEEGSLWRGRLSEVDGWLIGELTVTR